MNQTKIPATTSNPTIDQLSLDGDEERDVPLEIKNKNLHYWITRAYLLFHQLRKSCEPEQKKKQRASYESVFGSDFGTLITIVLLLPTFSFYPWLRLSCLVCLP